MGKSIKQYHIIKQKQLLCPETRRLFKTPKRFQLHQKVCKTCGAIGKDEILSRDAGLYRDLSRGSKIEKAGTTEWVISSSY